MHRDVDHAGGDARFLDRLDIGREALRELNAARGNAGENERAEIAIALDDLVRDPPQRTAERLRIEDADRERLSLGWFVFFISFATSRDRFKGSGGS